MNGIARIGEIPRRVSDPARAYPPHEDESVCTSAAHHDTLVLSPAAPAAKELETDQYERERTSTALTWP